VPHTARRRDAATAVFRRLAVGLLGEVDRLCGVMDAQLAVHRHLASDDDTIADVITWPWGSLVGRPIVDPV
jgi:glutathione S-transferase